MSDARRLFVTAWLVYAAFWNPWLQFSNASNILDAAVSWTDTGRWHMRHAPGYEGKDTATSRDGRVVPGIPAGSVVPVVPLYLVWRAVAGPAESFADLQAFNGFVALALGATAMALTAAQVAWLAGWLGAARRGQMLAAGLFAFGTQAFQFGTMVSKESLTALAVASAVRLTVMPGGGWARAGAGACAAAALALTHSSVLLAPLLAILIGARDGVRRAAAFAAGATPLVLAVAAYNTWMFGAPWRTSYLAITGLETGFGAPKAAILLDLLAGPRGGLFLYAPFLLLGAGALWAARHARARGEAAVTGILLLGIWLAAASWQSQFGERASWSHGLGARHLFPVLPLLAAFAGAPLERLRRGWLVAVAAPSLAAGYLGAQAGFVPESNAVPYALKTWLSGSGMGVFFKEALPAWLGVETVHTLVSRPEVGARDALALLPTAAGLALVRNQLLCWLANATALAGVAWLLRRVWSVPRRVTVSACAS